VTCGQQHHLTPHSYILSPLPVILFAKAAPMWQHWGWFTTGWLFILGLGIPIVLQLLSIIAVGNMWLSIAGFVVCYGSGIIALRLVNADSSSSYYAH
jgi:hypothetical protein